MEVRRLTHMGLCVSDLDRSLRFYSDVLGCKEIGRLDLEGEPVDKLNGMEGVKVRTVYVERDGWRIELIEFLSPDWIGPQAARPMNQLGLTHLSFRVEDLDEACERIEAEGGSLLADTRLDMPGARVIMALDPDGTRLELIEAPGDPSALPGGARRS